jgi:hypothetical protein
MIDSSSRIRKLTQASADDIHDRLWRVSLKDYGNSPERVVEAVSLSDSESQLKGRDHVSDTSGR